MQPHLSWLVGAAAAVIAAGLSGVGEASPPMPHNLHDAWSNLFADFLTGDCDAMSLMYDEDSVMDIYNAACWADGNNGIFTEYKGRKEWRDWCEGWYPGYSKTWGPYSSSPFPIVIQEGSFDVANVFVSSINTNERDGPDHDNFSFKKGWIIRMQHVFWWEPLKCPAQQGQNLAAPVPAEGPISNSWQNYWAAFTAQRRTDILKDYTEESVIRVYDWTTLSRAEHRGLAHIADYFDALWASMNAAKQGDDLGLEVANPFPRVDPGRKDAWLVWRCFSLPSASDNFMFNDDGKILVQNTMVSSQPQATMVSSQPQARVIFQ